jgi:hypothetical protein
MKKLGWLLAIFVVATAVREGYDYFGPLAQAYRTYREEARAQILSRKDDARFGSIEGSVIDVSYSLESAEHLSDGSVRIVVLEAVRFRKGTDPGPLGDRWVAKTRQRVVMRRAEGRWVVSDLVEDETEVTDPGAAVAP